jgi:purine-cytosine permease-like protein
MRMLARMRVERRASIPVFSLVINLSGTATISASLEVGSSEFVDADSEDALTWTWSGDAVTSWKIKWGTTSGVYTQSFTVADPNARAAMFTDFLTTSGNYYIVVFGVDAGGEGDYTDEVAISYTA